MVQILQASLQWKKFDFNNFTHLKHIEHWCVICLFSLFTTICVGIGRNNLFLGRLWKKKLSWNHK